MKSSLLIFILIISLVQVVLCQEKSTLGIDEIFNKISLTSTKSSDSEKALLDEFLNILRSGEYSEQTKSGLTASVLSHYLENGSFFYLQKAFKKHSVILKKKPILDMYWKTISLEYDEQFNEMFNSASALLRESEKSGKNQNVSDAYRLLARSKMYLNQKDSSLLYANLALNFAKRSDSKIAVANTFKDLSEIQAYFNMIAKSTSTLLKLNQEAERIKNYNLLCWSTLMIAERSFQVNSFSEAKTYYRKALNIAEKNNLALFKVRIFGGLAEIELGNNKLDAALININRGYKNIIKN
ncbi:MAG: hypothetical protein CL855_05205, partial [Cryomorphaceae bacterium]|nr:hypothetical protein [Cryomorphaceae bacterium]